ncbi:MAG TPA: hypothetical protein VHB51_00250 [Candidatus Saccharimonadales bacterium]|nr:hypothetical protein [Candidatus Saccharimonadales bacterium]
MKKNDLALLIVIAVFSGIISLVVSRLIFVTPANRQQSVKTVQSISTSFTTPSSQYFNSSSIDPTQLITIGDSNNQSPFSGSSNSR